MKDIYIHTYVCTVGSANTDKQLYLDYDTYIHTYIGRHAGATRAAALLRRPSPPRQVHAQATLPPPPERDTPPPPLRICNPPPAMYI
jgi:hypothetical protein